jgi:hypothetical protein
MKLLVFAACLAAATPAFAQAKAEPPPTTESGEKSKSAAKNKADDFDMAKLMGMFEKIFPAMPDPAPERLALARATASGMLPNGTYAGMFEDVMSGLVDRILTIKPADLGLKDGKAKGDSSASLRDSLVKDDPHFDERMKIMRRVVGEELIKLSAVMEPKLREGLARSIARRFDEKQLNEINAFLATDSGRAFAGQTMRMWVDPDVMRSMMQTMPHMIAAMPGAMIRLEAETAHLPKPRKPERKEDEEQEEPTT